MGVFWLNSAETWIDVASNVADKVNNNNLHCFCFHYQILANKEFFFHYNHFFIKLE